MFRRATVRLTVSYSLIQFLLFGVFALGIYFFVTGTFDLDGVEQDGEEAVNAAEQGFALLRTALLISTGVVLFVVPLSSWWMARAALRPIETSFERQRQFVDGASHELRTPPERDPGRVGTRPRCSTDPGALSGVHDGSSRCDRTRDHPHQ